MQPIKTTKKPVRNFIPLVHRTILTFQSFIIVIHYLLNVRDIQQTAPRSVGVNKIILATDSTENLTQSQPSASCKTVQLDSGRHKIIAN